MEEKKEPYYLETLNDRQKSAVLKTEGALLILAGAGAGKTKTVTHRILHLIRNGVRPSAVLAITFTNKAAKEMKERVHKLISSDTDFCPAIKDIKKRWNTEVLLYTYFDRKRKSKFSLSNDLIACCSKYFKLTKEDFLSAPLNKNENKKIN